MENKIIIKEIRKAEKLQENLKKSKFDIPISKLYKIRMEIIEILKKFQKANINVKKYNYNIRKDLIIAYNLGKKDNKINERRF